jgi:PAS domain S-box-containing protein
MSPDSAMMRWIVEILLLMVCTILLARQARWYWRRLNQVEQLGRDLAQRSHEALAREAEFNCAETVAKVGRWVYDAEADTLRLSSETCRIFGLPKDAIETRRSYFARVHPDDRAAVTGDWLAAVNQRKAFDSEHRILVGDTIRWVRQQAETVYDAQARPRFIGVTRDITTQKDHEAELMAAQNRLVATLDAIPDLLFEIDLDGRYYYYHSSRDDLLFTAPQHLLGRTVSEALPPDAAQTILSALREAHQNGRSNGKQFELTLPQGRAWFELSVSVKPAEPDQKPRFIVLSRDISLRKQAELSVLHSEMWFRDLLQNAPSVAVQGFAPDGTVRYWNHASEQIYGYTAQEAVGRNFCDLIVPPELHDEVRRAIEQMVQSGEASATAELSMVRKDRYHKAILVSYAIMRSIKGEPDLFCFGVDLSELRAAEAEVRTGSQFRELLLEAIPLPVFHKDASGRYTGCNSAFAQFVGKSKKELTGTSVFDISPPSLANTYRDKDLELLDGTDDTQTYESPILHADGSLHDVIFHKARIVDESGRPSGIIGAITDISDVRQMEAVRDNLEAQLRESQKMEALGTLAGGVAHDFNNFIAAIVGNTELARHEVGPAHPALKSLNEIRKASQRAKNLVQQILTFSRRQVLERKVILLAPIVMESVNLMRAAVPAGVRLNVLCAPDAPPVLADASQIEQVLVNLCTNSWQALQGKGSGQIEIRLDAYEQISGAAPEASGAGAPLGLADGLYTRLVVSDDGHGMDAATRKRIFEPFFTTKPVGEGTGLGLAVVHGILQEHGASLMVHSKMGQGTSFLIYFPAANAELLADAGKPRRQKVSRRLRDAPHGRAGGDPLRDGQGKRILYLDDDESLVLLTTRLLERQGYRVSGHTDAHAALAELAASAGEFDLVISDYNMPVMSGLEVAQAMRLIRADLPVVLTSGYITEELRASAPAAGVRELIYKPNTVEELGDVVMRLLTTLHQ